MTPEALHESDRLMFIVVGTSLIAEVTDRPAAYELRREILEWQQRQGDELDADERLVPVVCADLWYVNQPDLLHRPCISIGSPESNAASAMLALRLPTALRVEGALEVCMDPEHIDPRAVVWGAPEGAIADAVDAFVRRYLDGFLGAAHHMGE